MTAMQLDHVSYAVSPAAFASTWQRFGNALGASFADGGVHPGFGTRNVVLPLSDHTYVEIVTTLDHPAADRMPFGKAVKARAADGGGWLAWVVQVDDLFPFEERLGRPAVSGHRITPNGIDLRWRQLGVLDTMRDPQLPFFITWGEGVVHPSTGDSPIRIDALEICGHRGTLDQWLGTDVTDPLGRVAITFVEADEPGLTAVHFSTPHGPVRLD
jgi:hypothetical protein